jgi:hypothetical protein
VQSVSSSFGLNPLFSVKVIHVLLGLHAVCEVKPKNFAQKLLHSLTDIMKIQKQANGK